MLVVQLKQNELITNNCMRFNKSNFNLHSKISEVPQGRNIIKKGGKNRPKQQNKTKQNKKSQQPSM